MNTLVINPGSTAVKYTVFDIAGAIQGEELFSRKTGGMSTEEDDWLIELSDIRRIAIRIVHAGDLTEPQPLTPEVRQKIEEGSTFAPTHNPIAIEVLEAIEDFFPNVPVYCLFDSAFHKGLPPHARTYPIPLQLTEQHQLHRRGFHGIALASVLEQLELLYKRENKPLPPHIIMAHLGGGSSMTALQDGVSVDTTMGATPLEGIMMIERSGSIDPDLPRVIAKKTFQQLDAVSDMLNTQSGFFGLTGSKDTLDIINRAMTGEEPYTLAFDIYVHQVVKQIFAFAGVLQRVDALVFSGGIGYGNDDFRRTVLSRLSPIGITKDNTFVIKADEASHMFKVIQQTFAHQ